MGIITTPVVHSFHRDYHYCFNLSVLTLGKAYQDVTYYVKIFEKTAASYILKKTLNK